MSLSFHWFLPTNGDSRHVVGGGHGTPVTAAGGDRPPTVRYLAQIARAAEDVGFTGVLTPTGAWCEDAWLTTAMVSQHTERLKFLVAFRPGFISPTLAAQMASTYQRQTGGGCCSTSSPAVRAMSSAPTGTSWTRTPAMPAPANSWRSCGSCGTARPSTWTATTSMSSRPGSPSSPTPYRRSTSAAPPRPPDASPPVTRTSTSPGASPRRRSRRRSPGSGRSPPRRAVPYGSGSGCT